MTVIRAGGHERAHGESRNLLCRRRAATSQFEDCESIQNLILSLGCNDLNWG